ncbi:MAG: hypothetical protein ABI581_07305, partial [Sediminibacterium sp.]
MKKLSYILFITLVLFCVALMSFAGETKNDLSLTLGYYNSNNQMHYLVVHAKSKINKKFELIPGIKMRFYITNETPANLLGEAVTDNKGVAFVLIPPSAKQEWLKSAKQSFIVVSSPTNKFDEAKGTADITKARIRIDTTDDRKIVATLTELKDSVWVPIPAIEMKIGIRRLGADLSVNDAPTFNVSGNIT